jgi:hypothetical protein
MRAKKKMCYAIESACVQTRGGCTTECHKTAAINETSPAENGKAREGAQGGFSQDLSLCPRDDW